MPNKTLAIDQVLALLAATSPRLEELSRGLDATRLRTAAAPGEWSANDVLAHLRACADVWGGCITSIAGGAATLRAVNPTTYIEHTNYPRAAR